MERSLLVVCSGPGRVAVIVVLVGCAFVLMEEEEGAE